MKVLALLMLVLPCSMAWNVCCQPNAVTAFLFDSVSGLTFEYGIDYKAKKELLIPLGPLPAGSFRNGFTVRDWGNRKSYTSDGTTCTETPMYYPEAFQQCIPKRAQVVAEANFGPKNGGIFYKAYRYSVGPHIISMAVTDGCLPINSRYSGPAAPKAETGVYMNVSAASHIDFSVVDLSGCN
ncbi:uncharacterized protein LOC101849546 [Aplysia californica]|uniref:Uncharacterized protein LOC101849546 n=1 Tax=Aplysia californica TaxID=6500 RepID=A0ABM1A2F4_APLCA|nr:uncharacterized protein LOC101849546 [Aplysia californica]